MVRILYFIWCYDHYSLSRYIVTTPIHKTGKPDRLKDLHFNGKSEISLWYLWLRRKCVIVKSKLASSYLNISLYLFRVHAITTIALLKGIQCNLHSKYHGMLSPLLSWQSRYWLCGLISSLRRPYFFNKDLCVSVPLFNAEGLKGKRIPLVFLPYTTPLWTVEE